MCIIGAAVFYYSVVTQRQHSKRVHVSTNWSHARLNSSVPQNKIKPMQGFNATGDC